MSLKFNKCLGNPIAVWKNGKVVIISPEGNSRPSSR
jgi:hypothetical protein